MDPELEELPTDYTHGLDFRMTKTTKGGYADYNTSKWARKESALTEAEQAAIAAHGLFTLADFLPNKPGAAELKVIKEMFEASVEGQSYDAERWAQYYRPTGTAAPAATANTAPAAKAALAADVEEDAPVQVPAKVSSQKAEDILALIRARQKS